MSKVHSHAGCAYVGGFLRSTTNVPTTPSLRLPFSANSLLQAMPCCVFECENAREVAALSELVLQKLKKHRISVGLPSLVWQGTSGAKRHLAAFMHTDAGNKLQLHVQPLGVAPSYRFVWLELRVCLPVPLCSAPRVERLALF